MFRSALLGCLALSMLVSPAMARTDCDRFAKDNVTGTITETKVWKDTNGKPTTFLFRIKQTGGKCNVEHIEGPDNSKCKLGASVKASGWASYGAFGNKPDDFAPMLHATKMTCK